MGEVIFGRKGIGNGYRFLQIFLIGSSLETLALVDTESGFCPECKRWKTEPQKISEVLRNPGSKVPQDEGDIPPAALHPHAWGEKVGDHLDGGRTFFVDPVRNGVDGVGEDSVERR